MKKVFYICFSIGFLGGFPFLYDSVPWWILQGSAVFSALFVNIAVKLSKGAPKRG